MRYHVAGKSVRWLLAVGLFAVVTAASAYAQAAKTAAEINAEVAKLPPAERLAGLAAFDALIKDQKAPAAERGKAYLMKLTAAQRLGPQVPRSLETAEETWQDYSASPLKGTDARLDADMLLALNTVMQGYLRKGDVRRLDDALKTADALAQAEKDGASIPAGTGVTAKAQAYALAGETDKAIASYETRTKPPLAVSAAFGELADLYLKSRRQSEATAAIGRGLDAVDNAAVVDALSTRLVTCLQMGPVADGLIFKALCKVLLSPRSSQALLVEVTSLRLQQDKTKEALMYARMAYDLAPIDQMNGPIDAVSRCLKTQDMDMARVVRFVDFQKHGPDGPDGKAGTADDLKDPLSDAVRALPPEMVQAVEKQLAGMLPEQVRMYECLRDRATLQLALGRYPDALRSSLAAYAVANVRQVKEATSLVPRVLKAMDGNLGRANRYLEYVSNGPAGPDGKPGTPDDIADPLAGVTAGSLGADVEKVLGELAELPGTGLDACECRGLACLARGEYARGIGHMKTAYAFAGLDDRSLTRAVEDVAAAVKALDGHIVRANQYLLFQAHGAAGPDGKPGTADDLVNPVPAILKEIGKPVAAKP